jgi:hypothetical protein
LTFTFIGRLLHQQVTLTTQEHKTEEGQ